MRRLSRQHSPRTNRLPRQADALTSRKLRSPGSAPRA